VQYHSTKHTACPSTLLVIYRLWVMLVTEGAEITAWTAKQRCTATKPDVAFPVSTSDLYLASF
jgi:hypothetical protein